MSQRDLAETTATLQQPVVAPSPSHQLGARMLGALFAGALRLVDRSWKRDTEAFQKLDALIATGKPLLAVFWHGKYVPLFSAMAGRKAAAFTAHTFRGLVVAEICRRFGYDPVPLPRKGGQRSRALIREALRTRQVGAFAIDGPLGPYHAIKPGAIEFASELGGWLLPVTVTSRRRWVLSRRWDKMELPSLFTRLVFVVGEPIEVAPSLSGDDMAMMKQRVRTALEALDVKADAEARSPRGR